MITQLKYILLCFLLPAIGLVGCDTIHEFPSEIDLGEHVIDLDIDLNMAFDSEVIYQTYTRMLESDYDIRYTVEIYNTNEQHLNRLGTKHQRIVKTESEIIFNGTYTVKEKLKVPTGTYEIIAWVDFVEKGTTNDKYYETTDLQKITIIPQDDKYKGYTTAKDAFKGRLSMDIKPIDSQENIHHTISIEAKRPFAIYEIVTSDIKTYKTKHGALSYTTAQPITTNLYYNLFFPMGYNVFSSSPDNFKSGTHYTYGITESATEDEAVLASDIVFVENDTFYFVDFEIISAAGKRINGISNLKINLKRNKRTIIKGEFLTKDLDPNNGIGIDENFSDEIIIYI